jgi:hypothetical protein
VLGVAAGYLNQTEEDQSQFAVQNFALHNAAREAPVNFRGYAVMTRIRAEDHWEWKTWMCFETHGEASAHAREGDKIVQFGSAGWRALREQTAVAAPGHACADTDLPPKSEDETLVEFVFRLLSTVEIDLGLGLSPQQAPVIPQGSQDDDETPTKKKSA